MLASDFINRYEAYCPQDLSEAGDVRGLQIGTLNKEVKRVLVAVVNPCTKRHLLREHKFILRAIFTTIQHKIC